MVRQVAFGNKRKEYAIDSKCINWRVFNAGDPSQKGLSTNRRQLATARKLATIFFCVACSPVRKNLFSRTRVTLTACVHLQEHAKHTQRPTIISLRLFLNEICAALTWFFIGVWYTTSFGHALITGWKLVTFRQASIKGCFVANLCFASIARLTIARLCYVSM